MIVARAKERWLPTLLEKAFRATWLPALVRVACGHLLLTLAPAGHSYWRGSKK